MKLRVKNNSVRLRVTKSELAELAKTGHIEEKIEFGSEPHQCFVYAITIATDIEEIMAKISDNYVTVSIPKMKSNQWIETQQVGIKAEQNIGNGKFLSVLIEKDFTCLEPRTGGDDEDTFPHPLLGKV